LEVAVITTLVVAATGWVVIVKVPVVEPAGIVIVAGTDTTDGFALDTDTTVESGETASRVTVPVLVFPPCTEAGLKASELGPMGRTAI
jgi:hypothetical protein